MSTALDDVIKFAAKRPEISAVYEGHFVGKPERPAIYLICPPESNANHSGPIADIEQRNKGVEVLHWSEKHMDLTKYPFLGRQVWHRNGSSQAS